jgi:hypothetical protein
MGRYELFEILAVAGLATHFFIFSEHEQFINLSTILAFILINRHCCLLSFLSKPSAESF